MSQPLPQSPHNRPTPARYPLQERYASAKDFLAEVGEYHGEDSYIVNPDKSVVLARCPACTRRAKDEGIARFKLMVTRCGGPTRYGWGVSAFCNCSDERIVLALARHKAERFRCQAEELEASFLGKEEVSENLIREVADAIDVPVDWVRTKT